MKRKSKKGKKSVKSTKKSKETNSWIELRVECPKAYTDAVSNRLFEVGADAVTESGTDSAPVLLCYFPKSLEKKIFKQMSDYLNAIKKMDSDAGVFRVSSSDYKDVAWKDKYKEHYKAQKLSHNFFLLPMWDQVTEAPPGYYPIRMEAGQAFGTGLHPSTRLSIKLIEEVVKKTFAPETLVALDVGTGTGILAIVAEMLGVKHTDAIDIDPVAIETAQENITINHCHHIELSTRPLSDFKKPVDLLISNILLETHRELFANYKRLTKPGGYLILAGLLGNQKGETLELAEQFGFKMIQQIAFQEWIAFLLSH